MTWSISDLASAEESDTPQTLRLPFNLKVWIVEPRIDLLWRVRPYVPTRR